VGWASLPIHSSVVNKCTVRDSSQGDREAMTTDYAGMQLGTHTGPPQPMIPSEILLAHTSQVVQSGELYEKFV